MGWCYRFKSSHAHADIKSGSTVYGLKEQDNDIYYTTFPPSEDKTAHDQQLRKYFLLDLSLAKLVQEW